MKRYFTIITLAVFWSCSALAGIIHVPQDQASIQTGINTALNGDTILVADNIYFENINFRGKAITVASYYIMDGDTNHINNTVIYGSQPSHPDSGSVVYFVSYEDTNSVLCGFTIAGGTGTVFSGTTIAGGGIFSYYSGPRISFNHIENNSVVNSSTGNTYGGGIYTGPVGSNTNIIIEHNTISFNRAEATNRIAFGGGICVSSNGKIMGNEIHHNEVVYSGPSTGSYPWSFGGGISCFNQSTFRFVAIKDNLIAHNQSSSNNLAYSGGVDFVYTNSDFSNNTIINNSVNGTNNFAAGMRILLAEPITHISNNIFSFNGFEGTQCSGGGLVIVNINSFIVQGNRFEGNNSIYGGGLYIADSSPLVQNNLIVNNSSTVGGGMLIFASTSDANSGPGDVDEFPGAALMGSLTKELFQETNPALSDRQLASQPQIVNNTVSGNTASSAGGGLYAVNSQVTVMNSILWDAAASEIYQSGGSIEIRHSDVQGGWLGDGNLDVDPLFANTVNYQLSDSSLCIGAGIDSANIGGTWYYAPPTDMGGNPRPTPSGCEPDIGAWESVLCGPATGLPFEIISKIPSTYSLHQSYPNPFNPSTTIAYQVPRRSDVRIEIYNMLGQKVRTLLNDLKEPGVYEVVWDGRNDNGVPVGSGVYLNRMVAGEFVQTRKMILMK